MHDGGGGEMSNKMKVPIRLTKIHHHSVSFVTCSINLIDFNFN